MFGSMLTVVTCTLLSAPPKWPPPMIMMVAGSSGMTINARV
jgi:hypothetical protein